MDFFHIKNIFEKMEFITRMGRLDIDAATVEDITREEAEKELKKGYVALRVWISRLASATEMDVEFDIDDDTEDLPTSEFEQLPLF